jgi:ABC-type nitrate/sulfonate/bicarbonate transport system substrate-binding protein
VQAEKAGLRDLGSAVQAIGPYQSTAGFVMRDWAKDNADTLVRYLQAYIEGVRWTTNPANKAAAVKMVMERMKLPDDIAAPAFDMYANPAEGFAKDLALNLDGLRNVLKLRAEITGSGEPPAADKYVDLSYYDRALKGLSLRRHSGTARSAGPGIHQCSLCTYTLWRVASMARCIWA